jgi:hypothetical protein
MNSIYTCSLNSGISKLVLVLSTTIWSKVKWIEDSSKYNSIMSVQASVLWME